MFAFRFFSTHWEIFIFSAMPVIGHIFPVWLKFKGGKGVAAIFGILGAFFGLPVFLAFLLLWYVAVRLVDIMSLVNLVVAVLIPFAFWLKFTSTAYVIFGLLLGIIIWWSHRHNIRRLLAGGENKISG
jgi:glycerol-3-phosphate acyltransferase PlsY